MTDSEINISLSGLASRLQNDPRFMSYVLAAYRQQEGLNVKELAQEFGTLPAMLLRLAICKRPNPNSTQFAEQVRELADYTLTDEAQLANILRQVDSLEKLAQRRVGTVSPDTVGQTADSFAGLLAAARDRDESEDALASDEQSKNEDSNDAEKR